MIPQGGTIGETENLDRDTQRAGSPGQRANARGGPRQHVRAGSFVGGDVQPVRRAQGARDPGIRLAFAALGGWDTHISEGSNRGQLTNHLKPLGDGLASFVRQLGPAYDDTVILVISEFGRTVAENGNAGTDHGRATAMLVLGGAVNGGKVLGAWPGLDPAHRFEGRDVAVTTDFRDLFVEVLARHLGAGELAAIFPGFTPDPARYPGVIRT